MTTDHAPRAYAEACRRRGLIHGTYQSWLSQNEHRLADKPLDLQRAMKTFARDMAPAAVAAGMPVKITKLDWEQFMRQFISQTRAQRFGPVAFTEAHEWKQQIDSLCSEYGWKWVAPPQPQIGRAA